MHELARTLAAGADLAQQSLIGRAGRPVVGEIGDEPPGQRSGGLFGTLCERVGRRGRGGDPGLDVGGGPQQPPRVSAGFSREGLGDLLI